MYKLTLVGIYELSRKHSLTSAIIYVGTGLLQKAGSFILLPFLIATLSPSDFTRFGLFVSLVMLMSRLLPLNVQSASIRLVFDHDSSADQASLLKTVLWCSLGLTTISLVIILVSMTFSGYKDPTSQGDLVTQIMIAVVILASVVILFLLASARVYSQAHMFAMLSIAQTFGVIIVYIVLATWFSGSYQLVVFSHALVISFVAIIGLIGFRKRLALGHFHWALAKESFVFAAPTAVSFATLWLISTSGRWIGAYYIPLEDLANYTLLTFIIGAVGMIGRALFDARIPKIGKLFAAQRLAQGRKIIWQTGTLTAVLVVLVYVGMAVGIHMLHAPLPAAYVPQLGLLALAGVIGLFDAVYLASFQMLTALKRTNVQAIAMILAGIVVILTSLVLVKELQIIGLILATAVGYALQAIILVIIANRAYHRAVITLNVSGGKM